MAEFVNREREIAELDRIAAQPSAQFIMVYGPRRVGKTTLLTNWAASSGLATFYWVAKREAREILMANFAQHVWAWEHGKSRPVERRLTALAAALGVTPAGLEPAPSGPSEELEQNRRRIAAAYGVEPVRVRIMIEL